MYTEVHTPAVSHGSSDPSQEYKRAVEKTAVPPNRQTQQLRWTDRYTSHCPHIDVRRVVP